MTHKLGDVVTAKVTDENDRYYYAQIDGETYEIDKRLAVWFQDLPMKMKNTN